jgi:hypothetical protein
LLSFTIVYFFEMGLFNGLQAIQIKKADVSGPGQNVSPRPHLRSHILSPSPRADEMADRIWQREKL